MATAVANSIALVGAVLGIGLLVLIVTLYRDYRRLKRRFGWR